ncbi:MAG: hypothetical protein F6K24_03710 [Okeania sp. SIO2D1]|nr:hypothetical protein [Okeania sp. SIO2D1]
MLPTQGEDITSVKTAARVSLAEEFRFVAQAQRREYVNILHASPNGDLG